jgi:hypothetical protein
MNGFFSHAQILIAILSMIFGFLEYQLLSAYQEGAYASLKEAFADGEGTVFSALSASYPVGVLDMCSAMVYYDWEGDQWYRFIDWQRSYDCWSFHAMAFWNPDDVALYEGNSGMNRYSGRGFQVMAVFNH